MKDIRKFLSKITDKKMLVVFPHPDDESIMAGGLILIAIKMGWQVSVLTLTEGGSGKIHINGRGRSAKEIRREEMAKAMSRLGVVDWVMWRFDDGRLKRTKKWKERLRKFFDVTNPSLVVSYDLSGVTGHPDHVSLAVEMLKVAREAGVRLLWPSFLRREKQVMVDRRVTKYLQKPVYKLPMNFEESWRKWRAVSAHRSQGLDAFIGMPWWIIAMVARTELYSEMKRQKKYRYRYVKFKM